MTTLLVCIVLGAGAWLFTIVTNDLVIKPIEIMLQKVKGITIDPLKAAHDEEERLLCEEMDMLAFDESQYKNASKAQVKKPTSSGKVVLMETQILEQTLGKIGALLALGFGEAGTQIIAENMANRDDVDPMLPGRKAMFIFGFCDIRNFTDATEVLQEGVMLFVNEISEIVHSIVNKYNGAANKNVGDAFLLVWKFQEEDQIYDID